MISVLYRRSIISPVGRRDILDARRSPPRRRPSASDLDRESNKTATTRVDDLFSVVGWWVADP